MPRGKRNNPNTLPMAQPDDKEKAGKILSDLLPLLDMTSNKPAIYGPPDALEIAVTTYFKHCLAHSLRPGIVGLCAAVGLSYKEYRHELEGMRHMVSSENMAILKKAHRFIDSFIEQTAAAGALNPVLAIFWQKNYTGLTDSQDISITPRTDITATKTLDQLERDIPIDETEKP